jgi:hypothetical protein
VCPRAAVAQVSFHRYGDYFPGTGAIEDVGHGSGRGYCVNVPLKDGMDDESYRYVYEPIMTKVRAHVRSCLCGGRGGVRARNAAGTLALLRARCASRPGALTLVAAAVPPMHGVRHAHTR